MDIAAVHVHIKISNGKEVTADKVGSFVGQGAAGVPGEDPVQVFAILRHDHFPAGPKALNIYRVHHDEGAQHVLRLNVPSQLHGSGDTGVFTAVDAGSDEQGGSILAAIDDGEGDFDIGIGYG